MSTLVMVESNGELCMAAESLTTCGSRKHQSHYVEHPEKIFWTGHSYVGSVGWTVNQTVLQSALGHGLELP
ncbi:MAG: MFS transporter, partial [bacterium]|nr:MFS transporter [bacterium]